jgi:beta-lysine 5,6-aminomutase beta subunit
MPEYDVKQVDPTTLRPYGDTLGDGAVQLSFTLPTPLTPESTEAARKLAKQLGLRDATVQHAEDLGGYAFFIIYGHTRESIDLTEIKVEKVETEVMDMAQCDAAIEQALGRKLRIVGACIGTDAHTVGIDAIMNMKGFDGHYGLERYKMVEAANLGAQVPAEKLLQVALDRQADAILTSQIVTEKGFHKNNLTKLVELAEAAGVRDRFIMVCGGPRISHELARELGYDAGFGRGNFAEHVCSFIIEKLKERKARGQDSQS